MAVRLTDVRVCGLSLLLCTLPRNSLMSGYLGYHSCFVHCSVTHRCQGIWVVTHALHIAP